MATGELENEACSGFGGCDFEHEAIDVDLTGSGGSSSFTVSESDELVLVTSRNDRMWRRRFLQ